MDLRTPRAAELLRCFRRCRHRFPSHEIVERLPGFVGNEFGHSRVIDEAEDQCYFRNEVDRSRREMDRVARF